MPSFSASDENADDYEMDGLFQVPKPRKPAFGAQRNRQVLRSVSAGVLDNVRSDDRGVTPSRDQKPPFQSCVNKINSSPLVSLPKRELALDWSFASSPGGW